MSLGSVLPKPLVAVKVLAFTYFCPPITSIGEEVKKLKPSHTAGGIVKSHSLFGKQLGNASQC